MPELAKPHDFWMRTCGYNTHHRGPTYAQIDTPWNHFTQDRTTLVCTLWEDLIVKVNDPKQGRVRRFVKLGGRTKRWKGVGVAHGNEARANLEEAIRDRKPVFGFEAQPQPELLKNKGERSIKHFYMDKVYQLRPWFGMSKMDLDEELGVEQAFRDQKVFEDGDDAMPANLFELVETTHAVPGTTLSVPSIAPGSVQTTEVSDSELPAEGNLTTEEYVRKSLPILVDHVLRQVDDVLVPMTYLQLAERLGRKNKNGKFWARGLGHVLGRVTELIQDATSDWREQPPYLTSIVVLANGATEGLPDDGVAVYWPDYPDYSIEEKHAKVEIEYQRILAFGGQWSEVLRLAGVLNIEDSRPAEFRHPYGRGGGGESDAHKALKKFAIENPSLFGAGDNWEAYSEYPLPSADVVDVVFKSPMHWIGVEVKSKTSDLYPRDYERGIYQAVKYKAVLEAMARVAQGGTAPRVDVWLALETRLPNEYCKDANTLGIKWLEALSPAASVDIA